MKTTKEKVIQKIIDISEEVLSGIWLFLLIIIPFINIVGWLMVLFSRQHYDKDKVTLMAHLQIWVFILELILFFYL